MGNNSFNYYDAFVLQSAYSEEMGLNLVSAIERGELGMKELLSALHTFENDADAVNHRIQKHLVNDFVVPMERTGMNNLAHALDDVSDAIEDIAIEAYVKGVYKLPLGGEEMMAYLTSSISDLRAAINLLSSMSRKKDEIKEYCIKVQSAESDCDVVFIESARSINGGNESYDSRQNDCAIIAAIEKAMDAVENAAERVEAIVAGNM